MNYSPLVSVIIPTFNRAYIIHKAIESVLHQKFKNFELIVIDDGSEDNTDEVISDYKPVIYIKKKHEGQAAARNAGLKIAKGEYIASLDSDDVWKDNYLCQSIGYILHNRLDMFFSNWEFYPNGRNDLVNAFEKSLNKKLNSSSFYLFEYQEVRKMTIKDTIVPSSGLIFRKSLMSSGWDKQVHIGDDFLLQMEFLLTNPTCRVGLTTEPLWVKSRSFDSVCDGRSGIDYRNLRIKDLQLSISKLEAFLTSKERKILFSKIVQNHIYIVYLSISGGKFDGKLWTSFSEILSKPLLSFGSLIFGVKKHFKQKLIGLK
jgi:glycosyltransferase involved in cell wall biosynthesis